MQVVRVPRTADVVDRHLAVAALVRQLRGPLRVPEATDVDAGAGVVVLSAVTGSPLRELLAGPVARRRWWRWLGRWRGSRRRRRRGAGPGSGRCSPSSVGCPAPADWAAIVGAAVGDPDIAAQLDA